MSRNLRQFRLARAQQLRGSQTDAERRLWSALRRLPLYGTHFRRQVSLGPYIADFACQRAKLVIEVDGGQHADEKASAYDAARTRWLEREGYRVLRFWNSDIHSNLQGVLEQIIPALQSSCDFDLRHTDHPTPTSPANGRRRRPSPSRGG